jgi:hypothetical protein
LYLILIIFITQGIDDIKNFEVAQKQAKTIPATVPAARKPAPAPTSTSTAGHYLGPSDVELDRILENLILSEAGETPSSLQSKKSKGAAVVAYLDRVRSERETRVAPIVSELEGCTHTLTGLEAQQTELRKQLEQVGLNIAHWQGRKGVLQTAVGDADKQYEHQVINERDILYDYIMYHIVSSFEH